MSSAALRASPSTTDRPTFPPPTHTHTQIEEQDKILAARRSNNLLDTTKIVAALPDVHIPEIHEACEGVRCSLCAYVYVSVCLCLVDWMAGAFECEKPAALHFVSAASNAARQKLTPHAYPITPTSGLQAHAHEPGEGGRLAGQAPQAR